MLKYVPTVYVLSKNKVKPANGWWHFLYKPSPDASFYGMQIHLPDDADLVDFHDTAYSLGFVPEHRDSDGKAQRVPRLAGVSRKDLRKYDIFIGGRHDSLLSMSMWRRGKLDHKKVMHHMAFLMMLAHQSKRVSDLTLRAMWADDGMMHELAHRIAHGRPSMQRWRSQFKDEVTALEMRFPELFPELSHA